MLFRILDHLINIRITQTARSLNADLLFLAGRLVLRRYIHNTVGVDIEGDFDLRHTARGRRNADQIELAEHFIVSRHLTLTLEDADGHGGLIVFRRREGLAFAGRDRRIAIDQSGKDPAQCLDAQRQRRHVEQQDIFHITLQHAGLNCRTHGDNLVRIDAAVRFLAEELLHCFTDLRHAGHAAYQDHFIDLARLQTGILQRLLARLDGPLHQLVDQGF